MISAEYLKSRLDYDPNTGQWTWLALPAIDRFARAWNTRYAGKLAGRTTNFGYISLAIDDQPYMAHRLAFVFMTGEHPPAFVDHINMNKADNRWSNLRQATKAENGYNTRLRTDNKSGHKGVIWHNAGKKWMAYIKANGTARYLGLFSNIDDAIAVRNKASEEYHGDFRRAA